MHNFIKPKSMNYKNVNSYISLIGLAPCLFFQLMFEENYSNIDELMSKYNIKKFEVESYLELLQITKLIQISILDEEIYYQLFSALKLEGDEKQKWDLIKNHKVKVEQGSNISKTYYDVFKTQAKQVSNNRPGDTWVAVFEKQFNTKIDVSSLMSINQAQVDFNFSDAIINEIINRIVVKCKKFNINYFNLVIKTFKKLEIQNAQQAKDFFEGKLFNQNSKADEYLQQLEAELKALEDK